jgi:hypothetical protein
MMSSLRKPQPSGYVKAISFGLLPALDEAAIIWMARTLGDFCQKTYHPACLFVRLRRCGNRYIVRLCAYRHALKTNENPAQSGMLFSANRLTRDYNWPNTSFIGKSVGPTWHGPSTDSRKWVCSKTSRGWLNSIDLGGRNPGDKQAHSCGSNIRHCARDFDLKGLRKCLGMLMQDLDLKKD